MNIEEFQSYCLCKKGVEECFPFDDKTLVFKVMGKMFALIGLENANFCNLKCDPEKAIELREQYDQIRGGYHMNKKHWNTIEYTALEDDLITGLIDHSYNLVVAKLPKKIKATLEEL